ncbi:hypothetical protein [Paraburkholderia phenoliruptrix]|uniref:hypothetical protein n=1 Tax=Paraburkholderia phenoliruptrix TaxID=252970 RepID=UPI0034CF55E7
MTKNIDFNTGKPAIPGVYKTRRKAGARETFSYWNGDAWHWDEFNPDAAREARYVSNFQDRAWAPIEQLH